MNTRIKLLTAFLALGCSASLCAQDAGVEQPDLTKPPHVKAINGQKRGVDRIDSKPNGDLVIYISGKPVELPRDKWIYAVGVKPGELDQARELIAGGKADEASELLKTVMKDSRYQSWDVEAGLSLVDLNLAKGDANAAVAVVRSLDKRYGDDARKLFPGLELAGWKTAVRLGETESLTEELDAAIAGKDRGRAARAQLIRGDLKAKAGLLKKAQLDYLRTVYFYAADKTIQPEALYRVAQNFKAMGDTSNAKIYFKQLTDTYPDSSFAAKASAE